MFPFKTMGFLLTVLITAGVTWFLLERFVYGHKAMIKHLWRGVHEFTPMLRQFKELGVPYESVQKIVERNNRYGRLINALLDYYHPDEESEYVQGHRYKPE